MKALINLITALIIGAWIIAIALISIQNITPISLQFLTFIAIPLPFGIVLAFSVTFGLLLGAIIPIFFSLITGKPQYKADLDPLENWEGFED